MIGRRNRELLRRGLSCGKVRRRHEDSWLDDLAGAAWFRWLLILSFALMAEFLLLWNPGNYAEASADRVRLMLLVGLLVLAGALHIRLNINLCWRNNILLLLIFSSLLTHLALARGTLVLARMLVTVQTTPEWEVLVIPHAFAPMVMCILLGRQIGIFGGIYGSLFICLLFPAPLTLVALISGIVIALVTVHLTRAVRSRRHMLRAGLFFGCAASAIFLLFEVARITTQDRAYEHLLYDLLLPILIGWITTLIVSGLLPLLESAFGITTHLTWLEMADLNHPLMRRLSLEAPGTYHHSLLVASLSEAAAEAVGANATMCRVCAYFHDIGKIEKAEYFVENSGQDHNPHHDLTPSMSALIIISHVKDGIDLAIKHRLDEHIIDVIEQHHGTTLVYYFYRKALSRRDEMLELVVEGKVKQDDVPEITEDTFRYPGPKPQSKETAIISLADSIESASRSLAKPTPQKVTALVDEIIYNRLKDGQLSECDLTMREIGLIKQSFITSLRSMMHIRPVYPKEEKGKDGRVPKQESQKMDRSGTGVPEGKVSKSHDKVSESKETKFTNLGEPRPIPIASVDLPVTRYMGLL